MQVLRSGDAMNRNGYNHSYSVIVIRSRFHFLLKLFFFISFIALALPGYAQRNMENLGRGTVAVRSSASQVFVSWRILGLEFNAGVTYNLYRGTTQIASNLNVSNYLDNTSANSTYQVAAVVNGVEQVKSPAVSVTTYTYGTNSLSCIRVPVIASSGYEINFVHVGDLDGDGEYDFVLTKIGGGNDLLEAYKRDGTFLWQLDCGPNSANRDNIEPGSSTLDVGHGDNWTVYDLNNDGKAEVIVRVANGVTFGNGTTFSNSDNNRQFIAVLDGLTGAPQATIGVPTDYLTDGPMNGHMGIAYLDGVNPNVIWSSKNRIGSGDFNHMITAYTWSGGSNMSMNWKFLTGLPNGHNIRCGDFDGDGKDEVCPFGFVIDDDGSLLYNLGDQGVIHGDRFHIGDLDPNRSGLEGYLIQQNNPDLAWAVFDAETGNILESQVGNGGDYARGFAGDLDPGYAGYELYTFTDGLYNVNGTRITTALPSSYPNLRIWWDEDLLSENLDNLKMTKWDYSSSTEQRLYTFRNVNQLYRNVPSFYGDILGDWREEVIYASDDNAGLLIFTPTTATSSRIYTLMHNPLYRLDCTNKGYYQSNMVDFYLGDGMTTPPTPDIKYAGSSDPNNPAVTYEAENRSAQSGTSIASNHSGYTGTGFVDYGGAGSWIEWNTVAGGSGGGATLTFRYANAPSGNRQCTISVNGNVIGNLTFPSTGTWNSWGTQSINASLNAGNNTVRVTASPGNAGPNLDHVMVENSGTSANLQDNGMTGRLASEAQSTPGEELTSISVHPNPATHEVTLTLPAAYSGEKEANLFDGMGMIKISDRFKDNKHTLYIGNLPPGIYILKVMSNKKMIVERVIKR